MSKDQTKICLIGGTGRSGTTILARIFAKHPDLARVPEWRFLVDPDGLLDFYASYAAWSPYHYDRRVKRLESLLRDVATPRKWGSVLGRRLQDSFNDTATRKLERRYAAIDASKRAPHFLEHIESLIAALTDFRFRGEWLGTYFLEEREMIYASPRNLDLRQLFETFLRNVIQDVLNAQGRSHYLEKNTWNILWFDKIKELLPEARMVHIYRDPRDVVTSFAQQTWAPSSPVQGAIYYRDLMERWREIRAMIPDDSYIEVPLEQLVGQPETTLRQICEFWELAWNPALLETDLSRANSGRWKKELSAEDQRKVQELLGEITEELGYQ